MIIHDTIKSEFVSLVDNMGSDLTVVNSARVSFDKHTTWETTPLDKMTYPNAATIYDIEEYQNFYLGKDKRLSYADWRLLKYLAEHKHFSPFRHVYCQFYLEAPEFVMRQFYKHAIGINYSDNAGYLEKDHAWNEISLRYVDATQCAFYVPEDFRKQAANNKQASTDEIVNITSIKGFRDSGTAGRQAVCEIITDLLQKYTELVDCGVAKEQARVLLPLNFFTKVFWSSSLQAVSNFIELRDSPHAQWEIQEYARLIKAETQKVAPAALYWLTKNKKQA